MKTETGTVRNLLVVPLANTLGSAMTAFLDQLATGHELRVVTAVETGTFDCPEAAHRLMSSAAASTDGDQKG